MNRLAKGTVWGAAGVALLLGGTGTFALWSDSLAAGTEGNTVDAGHLYIDDDALTGTWYDVTGLDVPATFADASAFETYVTETLTAHAEAEAIPVAVLVGDLDHFKAINDQHGHDVGDAVLQEAASAIQGAMRSLDHVYRLGGEEFVVLLPGADAAEAQDIAERIRVAVQTAEPAGLPVSISIGVAVGTEEIDVPTLMRSADEALYRAKRLGRNQVVIGGARAA